MGEKQNLDRLMSTQPGIDDENNFRQWIDYALTEGYEPARVDLVLWGVPNVAVSQGTLRHHFDLAPKLHGYDAWRRVSTGSLKDHDICGQAMRRKMHKWPESTHFLPTLTSIELLIRDYTEMFGQNIHTLDVHRQ